MGEAQMGWQTGRLFGCYTRLSQLRQATAPDQAPTWSGTSLAASSRRREAGRGVRRCRTVPGSTPTMRNLDVSSEEL